MYKNEELIEDVYIWWPGITKDIENTVRNYTACQLHHSNPPVAPLHPWSWPTRPWARLHLDYAGPFKGKMILLIDARSKWVEAICTHGSISAVVIDEWRTLWHSLDFPKRSLRIMKLVSSVLNLKPFYLEMESNISHPHDIILHLTVLPNVLFS